MNILKLAGIGCGGRTTTYMRLASQMPQWYELVGAADPLPERVERIRRMTDNPDFKSFASDRDLLSEEKFADIAIIGTQDAYHVAPCVAAMEKGYNILLEKPIATDLALVIKMEKKARELGRKVIVCHVLRYTPFYRKVKEIVDSGVLGEIITLNAVEGVGQWHQAHSYVRGHWAVTEDATPMIIAKSCHDMDIIAWLMGRKCRTVSSFGGLSYFTASNAPEGAPARCTDGCPHGMHCHYNALNYLGKQKSWLQCVYDKADKASDKEIRSWLAKSKWGRCVYRCDNTAVDHQVVSMRFDNGATASFTMTAFENGRHIEICGTKGKLRGGEFLKHASGHDIVVVEHEGANRTAYDISHEVGGYSGHGGGDPGLMMALYDEMMKDDSKEMRSSIHMSVESHVMGYAAEASRISGKTVDLEMFYAEQAK